MHVKSIEESSGVITTSDQREQTVFIGSSVDLTCNLPSSVSKEYVRFKWTRDRGSLPPTAFQDTNKLQIVNVQPSDAGRYICEASSAGGVSTEYVLLKVESKSKGNRARKQRSKKLK